MKSSHIYHELILSGISNILESGMGQDFKLYVNEKCIHTNKSILTFLSPTIGHILKTDPLVSSLEFETKVENENQLVSFLKGFLNGIDFNEKYFISDDEMIELFPTMHRLVKKEIMEASVELDYNKLPLSVQLKAKLKYDLTNEILFIRKHFIKIPNNILVQIPLSILETSISNNENSSIKNMGAFVVEDEDSLFRKILELGVDFFSLLSNIQFEYLSTQSVDKFLHTVSFADINCSLWDKITKRLLYPISKDFLDKKPKIFDYTKNNEFEGIFYHLSKECGGNVHLKGIVKVTSNGDSYKKCYNIVDSSYSDFFYPNPSIDSYIQFDFINLKVQLKTYTLKSNKIYGNKLINWEIVGSNDCKNWAQLDERHVNEWNGHYNVATYSCRIEDYFRYIRIRLMGTSSSNGTILMLSNIELYGNLIEK